MKKATKPDPWQAIHKPTTVASIASFLEISPARVRQIIGELKLKPVDKIGNVPFYDNYTFLKVRNRNTKPGPKGGKK